MSAVGKLCVKCGAHICWEPDLCYACRAEGHRALVAVAKGATLRDDLLEFRNRKREALPDLSFSRRSRRVYIPRVS